MNLRGKKVTVMGLGLHGGGVEVVKFLVKEGAKVLVTDTKSKKELKESLAKLSHLTKSEQIKYVLGKHRAGDFKNTDLVIKNPAVAKDSRYLKIARKSKIPIETDIGLFFKLCPSKKIIGVTGTKGKSTTASLINKFLKTKYKTVLAGNIRVSVLKELPKIRRNTVVILELSSWQLEDLKRHKISPHIAVITNIMPDHLNRYKGMKDYIEAKKLIFKFQKPDDFLILNNDDKIVRGFAKKSHAKTIFYSKTPALNYLNYIQLKGEHNLYNISAAITTAKLFKISDSFIKKVLKNFRGIEGRLEFVLEIKGVKYYNDTTATTPEATISALKSFSGYNIILIAGGTDKNLKFKNLVKEIIQRVKFLILLPGTASDKMRREIKRARYKIETVNDMEKAVKIANKKAEKGDVVLLSPGCASFGLFKHEFDRGNQFKLWVENLKK